MKHLRQSFLAVRPSKRAPLAVCLASDQAFTLVELVVVLAVLAVLGGMLLPALAATHDRSSRTVCQDNLRQIAVAATQYAGDNNDYVFPAGANLYPLQFDDAQLEQSVAGKVGLTTNMPSIWTCPNRPTLPMLVGGALVIGYQYYGGITNWINVIGDYPSLSPIKLSQSKPYWMLAADVIAQPDGVNWGGTNYGSQSGWANLPAHHTADTMVPEGGNEVFCDGSVQWIDIHKMYNFHTWGDTSTGGQARLFYFYQDVTGDPYWGPRFSVLYRAGVTSPGTHW